MKASRPLRVAYVAMRYPLPSETFATNDVRALTGLGVEILVLPLRGRSPDGGLLRERGVDQVPVVPTAQLVRRGWLEMARAPVRALRALLWVTALSWRRPRALAACVWLWPAAVGATATVRRGRCDVVHLRWGHYPALVGALVRRWAPHVRVSLSLSAYDLEKDVPIARWLAPRADVVRTLGRVNVQEVASRFGRAPDAVDVIVDGVPDEVLEAPPEPKVPGLVVTAGRFIASKRVDDALRAFALVCQVVPHARLELLGDGPERGQLEDLARVLGIADRVRFRGMVPYREVVATLRRSEVFVFLSDKTSERLPNVVKEAQAGGCAVVAAVTPGMDELVAEGVSGYLVAPRDVGTAADRILRLLQDPSLRERLGGAGRSHVRESFRLSRSAAAYVSAWTRETT